MEHEYLAMLNIAKHRVLNFVQYFNNY